MWGIARARLEVAIELVMEKVALLQSYNKEHLVTNPSTDKIRNDYAGLSTCSPSVNSTLGKHDRRISSGRKKRHIQRLHSDSYMDENDIVDIIEEGYEASVKTSDELPGLSIALPVQNLHEVSLRAMLDGGSAEMPFCYGYASTLSGRSIFSSVNKQDFDATQTDTDEFLCAEAKRMVIHAVRRHLCPALRDLIEHGLIKKSLSTVRTDLSNLGLPRGGNVLLRPILGCFTDRRREILEDGVDVTETAPVEEVRRRNTSFRSSIHAWHVVLKFYHTKNGQVYNQSAARRLSASFNLDSFGGKSITSRQRFFNAIGLVLEANNAYRRSDDSKFKAFVSIALNEGKLASWLSLLFKQPNFITPLYQPWSYTLLTGFTDALQSLNQLSKLPFNLPYDYSVRHPREIRDAF